MIDYTFAMQLDDLDLRTSVMVGLIRERTRWASPEYVSVLAVRLAGKCHSLDRHDLGQRIGEDLARALDSELQNCKR